MVTRTCSRVANRDAPVVSLIKTPLVVAHSGVSFGPTSSTTSRGDYVVLTICDRCRIENRQSSIGRNRACHSGKIGITFFGAVAQPR